MDPVLCTRGALAAAVAMAFAGAAFAGGPGINLPAPALQEGFSASTASSTPASRSITPTAPRAPA